MGHGRGHGSYNSGMFMMDWFSVRLDQITIDFFDLFVMHGDCPGPQRLKLTLTWFKMCTMIKSYFIGFPLEKDGHPATSILIEVNSGPIPNSNPMCLCLQCDWFPLPLNSSAWHIARHLEPRADVPSKAESKQRAGPLPKRTMNWWNGGFFRGSQVLENSNCKKKEQRLLERRLILTLYEVFGIDSTYNDGPLLLQCYQRLHMEPGRPDVMYEKIAADTMMVPWLKWVLGSKFRTLWPGLGPGSLEEIDIDELW